MTTICEVVEAYKSFGAVRAIAGVSLGVQEGEILGLVGPNGSGKTTLFNCISGRYKLNSGKIIWLGTDITRWSMHRIARRGLVRTFQQSMYFPSGSVRENLTMAVDIARAASPRSVITTVGAEVDRLVKLVGLEELSLIPTTALGHGPLRQLGIALALATSPKLLLLDEPAAGLSDSESDALSALLKRLRSSGVTIVAVDHDMAFVMPLVDRLVVLSAGKKLAEGRASDVRNDPDVIEVYLGSGFSSGSPPAARDGRSSNVEAIGG